jgi:branched-subunit amino acid aminotransferase/4-amino-4-deoxychorismate lyase
MINLQARTVEAPLTRSPTKEEVYGFTFHFRDLKKLSIINGSMDDAIIQMGLGTYTVFPVYPGKRVLKLEQHLDSMRYSAKLLGMPFPHTDDGLRAILRRVMDVVPFEHIRICMLVPCADPETVLLGIEPYHFPNGNGIRNGVKVGLTRNQRKIPEARDSRFVILRRKLMKEQADCFEIIIYNSQGDILEGANSNFFAVIKDQLRTSGKNVLPGITRNMLLQMKPTYLPVLYEPVHYTDLPYLDEAMITSSSWGIIPVVQVNRIRIGDGRPGPITEELQSMYQTRTEAELEKI